MEDIFPRMLTIRQVAAKGVLSEHAIRLMVKSGQLPYIVIGTRVLINFDKLIDQLKQL